MSSARGATRALIAAAAVSVLSASASACGQELDAISVADAAFGDVDWSGAGAIVGVWSASGTLFITDTDGGAHELPITLEGPTIGLVFDIHGSADDGCLFDDGASLDLSGTDGDITARDIGGLYFGTSVGAHMGIGAMEHELSNGNGVRVSGGGTGAGMGVWVGLDWLGLSIAD